MRNTIVGALALAATVATVGVADEALKSGLQPGARVSAFHPLNVTGKYAGQKNCLVWNHGGKPVAMIFAREVSDSLTSLVKKIDAATGENKAAKMASFVVFLSDDEALQKKIETLAEKEGIKNLDFAIDNVAGPKAYKIAKDADVTVILYNRQKVEANHAFRKGELNAGAVEKVVGDLKKILPSN